MTIQTLEPHLIDSLRQGTAFFASACMIAIGGGIAVIGNAAAVQRGITASVRPSIISAQSSAACALVSAIPAIKTA